MRGGVSKLGVLFDQDHPQLYTIITVYHEELRNYDERTLHLLVKAKIDQASRALRKKRAVLVAMRTRKQNKLKGIKE